MNKKSMTALVSAFSRGYHSTNNSVKVFNDDVAFKLLTEDDITSISKSMSSGIGFFNPDFKGSSDEALKWIVDSQLSPTPLGRAAFTEDWLEKSVSEGIAQYVIVASGYDTFAYRRPGWAKQLKVYEIDQVDMIEDKICRVNRARLSSDNTHYIKSDLNIHRIDSLLLNSGSFNKGTKSFVSLLGISYYIPKESLVNTIKYLRNVLPSGSYICLDYNDEYAYTEKAGDRAKKQAIMAKGANEQMLCSYSSKEFESLMADIGIKAIDHISPDIITERYFKEYNNTSNLSMSAFDNVNYYIGIVE